MAVAYLNGTEFPEGTTASTNEATLKELHNVVFAIERYSGGL